MVSKCAVAECNKNGGKRGNFAVDTERKYPTNKGTKMAKEIKDKFTTLRIPESVLLKLKKEAEKNTRTVSAQALHFIKQGLEKK